MSTPAARGGVRVWDRPVRALHALLALATLGCWLSGGWPALGGWPQAQVARAHELLGYAVGAVVLARVAWGWCGNRHARFAQFLRSPTHTWRYAVLVWHRRAPRHLGHNPLGGWMVISLLATAGGAALSGALYTSDWLWGYAWLYRLHATLAWGLMALVALHLGGVWFTGRCHQEALVAAMLHGRKRG